MIETKAAPDSAVWALSGRIATEIMGWQTRVEHVGRDDITLWIDPGGHEHLEPMRYATSPSAVVLVEDEIERRELQDAYVRALQGIVWSGESAAYDYPDEVRWRLIRATPEQRCRAVLEAVKGIRIEG